MPTTITDRNTPVTLSIVSNSQLLSEGLPELLRRYLDFELVSCYRAEPPAFTTACFIPDVVLLDMNIGQEIAIAWTRWWRTHEPPPGILVLELLNNFDSILACIEAGAGGYVLQGASGEQVALAIIDLQAGIAQCSPEITAMLFQRLAQSKPEVDVPADLAMPLTAREIQVLCCIARGDSNKEIAVALHIELYTVKHHVHHILSKLGTKNRWEAVHVARQRRWLAQDDPGTIPF
jgi:DNA-binding NarL/FixJ family response regulator